MTSAFEMPAKDDVNGLIEALKNADQSVRFEAIKALGSLGMTGKVSSSVLVGPLIEALNDVSAGNRASAVLYLGALRDPAAADALIAALTDVSGDVRAVASVMLGRLGPGAIVPLIAALEDKNKFIRKTAAKALAQIKADSKS